MRHAVLPGFPIDHLEEVLGHRFTAVLVTHRFTDTRRHLRVDDDLETGHRGVERFRQLDRAVDRPF
jgi:hypothetical protein